MSLYTRGAGIGGESEPRPLVVVNANKAQDGFWTAVKWMGAALTLVVGYREARSWYREKLGRDDAETARELGEVEE